MINIDQYWSGLFFTEVSDSVSKQLLCRVLINIWSILINIDQYRSILIRTFLYQSLRLCFKTTIMPSLDQYWSILINIDQYIDQEFSLPKSQTLFQNNYYADFFYKSDQITIMINPDQYRSILDQYTKVSDLINFFLQISDSVSKQLLCRVLRSILIKTTIDAEYWSI